MGRNAIETLLGAVVLVVAGFFIIFAYTSADLRKVEGYTVTANFPMVDGIKDGTDVRVNGVKVGSIASARLITDPGPTQYLVEVKMTIMDSVTIPDDTIAMVATESLLGGKYLSLEMGVDEEMVPKDGTGKLTRTQAPMRLDDLIGQLIYSKKAEGGAGESGGSAATSAAPTSVPDVQPAAPAQPEPAEMTHP